MLWGVPAIEKVNDLYLGQYLEVTADLYALRPTRPA